MMVDNVTLIDPINGIATVAVYKHGDVRIGVWAPTLCLHPTSLLTVKIARL